MISSPLAQLTIPISILTALVIAYLLSYKKPNFSLKRFIVSGLITSVVTIIASACLVYPLIYALGGQGGMGLILFVLFVLSLAFFLSIYWVASTILARLIQK